MAVPEEFLVKPNPADSRLSRRLDGVDQDGVPVAASVIVERPLTLFLNGQEIVTMMTIGDYPEYLALVYMKDAGGHNYIDKTAGSMRVNRVGAEGKMFYTTGRLTSEMVTKSVQMGIPILISRPGFTAWGVELARTTGLILIGRAKEKHFVCRSGEQRLIYDADPDAVLPEAVHLQRKGSLEPNG